MGMSSGKRRSARPIIATVVALLIALQSLAALGTSHARPPGFRGGAGLSAIGVACNADIHGGESSPAPGQRDHSQCCIFCIARDHDLAPSGDAVRSDAATIYPPTDYVRIVRRFVDDPDARPFGWTGAWSSRAPPIFS